MQRLACHGLLDDVAARQRGALRLQLGVHRRAPALADVVTRMTCAITSCSACASRSAATKPALAESSAITSTSDGPAGRSMAAPSGSAGHQLFGGRHPGAAGAEDLVDLAHGLGAEGQGGDGLRAAHLVDGVDAAELGRDQHGRVQLALAIAASWRWRAAGHPAMRAGTASMMAVEGSGADPAGTYRPTLSIGRVMRSQRTPGMVSTRQRLRELRRVETRRRWSTARSSAAICARAERRARRAKLRRAHLQLRRARDRRISACSGARPRRPRRAPRATIVAPPGGRLPRALPAAGRPAPRVAPRRSADFQSMMLHSGQHLLDGQHQQRAGAGLLEALERLPEHVLAAHGVDRHLVVRSPRAE